MARAPLGSDSIVASARYLGIAAVCRTVGPVSASASWSLACLDLARRGTRERRAARAEVRTRELYSRPGPPFHRACCWNTYVVSLAPYPAQLCLPDRSRKGRLARCVSSMFKTVGWAPWWSMRGLGPYFGALGSPRCPWSVASAAGSVSWTRGGGWGPPPVRAEQQHAWERIVQWAGLAARRAGGTTRDCFATTAARTILEGARDRLGAGTRHPRHHGTGRACDVGDWLFAWKAPMRRWLSGRTAGRRWMRTDGREWMVLEGGLSFTRVVHAIRLLLGGLGLGPRRRSLVDRAAHPRRWHLSQPGEARWSFLTPGAQRLGFRLCRSCIGDRTWAIRGWPLLRGCGPTSPGAASVREGHPSLDPVGLDGRRELACPCPLCGLGAAGSEHLCICCSATAEARDKLQCPSGRSLVEALRQPGEDAVALAALLHQASFLHGSCGAPPCRSRPRRGRRG